MTVAAPQLPKSAPSSSSRFSIGQYFRRSPAQARTSTGSESQPARKQAPPRSPELPQQHTPNPNMEMERSRASSMQRSSVFGSCSQCLGMVASMLFTLVNQTGHYDEAARDNSVTRRAKMLYILLLESVQKERGEWQGFSSSEPSSNNGGSVPVEPENPRDLLVAQLVQGGANTPEDQLGVLSELLEVSFRNLLGPLVPIELYASHKKLLLRESLAVPPALTTLMAIRGILDRLEREVRHCLLRLFSLWDLVALVSGDAQPLLKTLADKHHHVFSESAEFESTTARKSGRQDVVAVELLQIMVLYRDILFSDIEFILTKQELQIRPQLAATVQAKAWPVELEPAVASEEEDFYSDADAFNSDSGSENQQVHDEEDDEMLWEQEATLEQEVLPPFASTSLTLALEQEGEMQREDDYYGDYQDGVNSESDWAVPSPPRQYKNKHRHNRRAQNGSIAPGSGGADHLLSVSSGVEGPPPRRTHSMPSHNQPMIRVSSGRRQSQRSSSTAPDSPTWSAASHASSSARSSVRRLKHRGKQASAPTRNGRDERHRREAPWQDNASNESRSPPPPVRSVPRKHSKRRVRGSSSSWAEDHSPKSSPTERHSRRHDGTGSTKRDASSGLLQIAASYCTLPVAAATLCVAAAVISAALWGMRHGQRS